MSHDDAKKEVKPDNDWREINALNFIDRMEHDQRITFLTRCCEMFGLPYCSKIGDMPIVTAMVRPVIEGEQR
jgi:hypothetical protein